MRLQMLQIHSLSRDLPARSSYEITEDCEDKVRSGKFESLDVLKRLIFRIFFLFNIGVTI